MMHTLLEFHLRRGQAMRDLREAAASTPRVSLGAEGEMLLTFTKPDGTLVTVMLRDVQEHWAARTDVAQSRSSELPQA